MARSLLEGCKSCAVHFGLGIHYMTKAMSRAEVAHMFAAGYVCFRAFNPATRAPALLPHYLMPSIPSGSKTVWRNKDERAADRAAKAAKRAGLPPPPPPPPAVPLEPGGGPPAVPPTLADGAPRSSFWMEGEAGAAPAPQLLLATPQKKRPPPPVSTPSGLPSLAGPGPHTPDGGEKKQKRALEEPRFGGPNEPHTLEAALARSGRGRTRVNLHPIVRSSERCGQCKACLNPGWKKACDTRRAEMLHGAAAPVAAAAGPPPPPPPL